MQSGKAAGFLQLPEASQAARVEKSYPLYQTPNTQQQHYTPWGGGRLRVVDLHRKDNKLLKAGPLKTKLSMTCISFTCCPCKGLLVSI